MSHLISIIIPFKNTAAFLEECINSILNQTYGNWEAIFIDDLSSDQSYAIVDKYAKTNVRIQLVKNEEPGIIGALRTGYGKSSGQYITRMDSDDIMCSDRLEIMLHNLLKFGKSHLAVGQVKYFRAEGVSNGYRRYEKWINNLTRYGANYEELYKECVIPSPCWMIHREDFDACDGFNSNRYPEDYDLTFRFYKHGYKCIPCSKVLLFWRDYSSRTSRTHEHYAQNYFLDIKVHYFLKLDYDKDRPLSLWGAGSKGKTVAKLLLEQQIPFYWICDNPKKIGRDIYGQKMLDFKQLTQLVKPQSIVTVANEQAQIDIKNYFNSRKMQSMTDYFFFC